MNDDINPLIDPNLHQADIKPDLQEKMNKPPVDPTGFSQDDKNFLHDILTKVDNEQINVYVANSLYNDHVVDPLDDATKARIEVTAHSMLATIRDIHSLWEYYKEPNYQIQNLIHKLRIDKERFEHVEGDVFII